jgi:hypothetical protein
MSRSRLLCLTLMAVIAVSAGSSSASSEPSSVTDTGATEVWQPTERIAYESDKRAWTGLLDGDGRGTIFSGGVYRDYRVVTGQFSAPRTLAKGQPTMHVDAGVRGQQCALWDGDFGVALACRETINRPWTKVTVSRQGDAQALDIAVGSDGRDAIAVWARMTPRKAKIYASRFDLTTKRLDPAFRLGSPLVRRLPVSTEVFANATGYTVAHGKQGDDPDRVVSTYLQSTLDGRIWNNLVPVRMETPDGRYRKVVLTELRSRSFGAFGLATQVTTGEPTEWMLASLQLSAVLPVATLPPMLRPTLAVVGDRATVIGASPTNGDLLAYRPDTRVTTTITAPTMPEGDARIGHFSAIGQTSGPRAGFTVVAEYFAYDGTDERADRLFAVSGFIQSPNGGMDVSAFTELTSRPSYEDGMSPRLSGGGRYALVVYGAGGEIRFGARSPK